MEQFEGRVMNELKELHAWKNRAIGAVFIVSGVVSFVIKHL